MSFLKRMRRGVLLCSALVFVPDNPAHGEWYQHSPGNSDPALVSLSSFIFVRKPEATFDSGDRIFPGGHHFDSGESYYERSARKRREEWEGGCNWWIGFFQQHIRHATIQDIHCGWNYDDCSYPDDYQSRSGYCGSLEMKLLLEQPIARQRVPVWAKWGGQALDLLPQTTDQYWDAGFVAMTWSRPQESYARETNNGDDHLFRERGWGATVDIWRIGY